MVAPWLVSIYSVRHFLLLLLNKFKSEIIVFWNPYVEGLAVLLSIIIQFQVLHQNKQFKSNLGLYSSVSEHQLFRGFYEMKLLQKVIKSVIMGGSYAGTLIDWTELSFYFQSAFLYYLKNMLTVAVIHIGAHLKQKPRERCFICSFKIQLFILYYTDNSLVFFFPLSQYPRASKRCCCWLVILQTQGKQYVIPDP